MSPQYLGPAEGGQFQKLLHRDAHFDTPRIMKL